jgi:tetratricopeptide (TPR) repeat protein
MKTKRFLMIAVMIGMAMSVSAQVASDSKYGHGEDSVACVTNLSMYREYFKQWEAAKYAPESISMEMVNAWRAVFLNCPRASQFVYTNGEKIMEYFIRTNPKDKDAYIDTLCLLMDTRAQYFPTDPKTGASQVANIMGRKGLLIYTYNKNRYEEAYNVLKDAVALDPSQLQGAYIDAYFKATIDMVNNNKAEKMTIINVYQELSEVLDNNIGALAETETELQTAKEEAETSGDADAVAGFDKQLEKNEKNININKGVKNNLDNLFQPYASCEDLIKVFSAKMKETPDDVTLLKRITTILDKKDCTDSKLFLDAAVKLNELEPSPEASYSLGIKFFKDRKYSDAATFFDQATKTENNDRKYRAYRNLGMCYQNMGSFSRARDIFRRAAQVDPTNGEPYLLIAMLYAESAKQFSGDIDSKAVYWAAVDKCIKAKSIDPSIADRANSSIRSYSAKFPSMETIFFNDYSEGQSYNVGGWIGETTTIRARK